jgi:energy-coupling factor transporter ATP-binding protein EcfA2
MTNIQKETEKNNQQAFAELVERLQNGKPPNGTDPKQFGEFEQDAQTLLMAAGDGAPDVAAVTRAVEQLTTDPAYAFLLPSDGPEAPPRDADSNDKASAATKLVRLAEDRCEFMRSDGLSYAKDQQTGEVLPLSAKAFEEYLSAAYLRDEGKVAPSGALADALTALRGIAAETEADVHVRTCGDAVDGVVYLDLGEGRVTRVTRDGITTQAKGDVPVHLWAPSSAMSLPDPDLTGTLDDVGAALSLDGDALLVAAGWLLAALLPGGPYPVLAVYGPQGSGKSTRCRQLNRLIDPAGLLLRTQPKKSDDLIVAARAAHVLSFDNVSKISDELSDGLCRIATGGGIAKRTLYTDADVTVVNVKRPVVINAIVDVVKRSDLADRLMLLELDRVAERRTERQVDARFIQHQAKALGALLKGVQAALRDWTTMELPTLPRMADACLWAEAGMQGLGAAPLSFYNAFTNAAEDASARIIEGDLVGSLVQTLATRHDGFRGTASVLLERMQQMAQGQKRSLPSDATQLSIHLKRIDPALRHANGWGITFNRTRTRRELVIPSVAQNKEPSEDASHASHASQDETGSEQANGKTADSGSHEQITGFPF